MLVNMWIAIPEADHNELNNRRGTESNVGPAKQFVDGQLDPDVVQNLYQTRTAGPQTWHLWSVILNDEDGTIVEQVNAFRQEFAGAQVLGCWKQDGAQLGCQLEIVGTPNPAYTGEPYMIPNPNYQPDHGPGFDPVPDYDPREEVRNPAYVDETIYERIQVGAPQYDIPTNLSAYMPDNPDGSPNPTVRDVHLPAGWAERIF